jgi:S1-C subfamily serine protease
MHHINKSVFYLKVQGLRATTGSGFLIAADQRNAWVATNAHVVSDAVRAMLRDPTQLPQIQVGL